MPPNETVPRGTPPKADAAILLVIRFLSYVAYLLAGIFVVFGCLFAAVAAALLGQPPEDIAAQRMAFPDAVYYSAVAVAVAAIVAGFVSWGRRPSTSLGEKNGLARLDRATAARALLTVLVLALTVYLYYLRKVIP